MKYTATATVQSFTTDGAAYLQVKQGALVIGMDEDLEPGDGITISAINYPSGASTIRVGEGKTIYYRAVGESSEFAVEEIA